MKQRIILFTLYDDVYGATTVENIHRLYIELTLALLCFFEVNLACNFCTI